MPADANKVFRFFINIDGVDEFLIQEVTGADPELGVVKHGASNYDKKTAGGYDISPAELKGIKPVNEDNVWAIDWLLAAQNPMTGTGGQTADYQRTVIFGELTPDGLPINMVMWENAWVNKVKKGTYKRGNQNENIIEAVTLQIEKEIPV